MDGEQVLAVARNRYGTEILNADRILIADIDLPELVGRIAGSLLGRLFRRSKAVADPSA